MDIDNPLPADLLRILQASGRISSLYVSRQQTPSVIAIIASVDRRDKKDTYEPKIVVLKLLRLQGKFYIAKISVRKL